MGGHWHRSTEKQKYPRLFDVIAMGCCLIAGWLPLNTRAVPVDLAYPQGNPAAAEIAAQVYFVNHFYALKNYAIEKVGDTVTLVINKTQGDTISINTVERYLNNNYQDGVVKAKDLAIFSSGRLQGTGMLITEYQDESKSQTYEIWLPRLRKIRRFAEPAHDDAWSGSVFTFGDVYLRRPHHEQHELLESLAFPDCLRVMEIPAGTEERYLNPANLPQPYCFPKGRLVYQLKSTPHPPQESWYDYRISYVDAMTFADYRTEYFKNGTLVKLIDRAWDSLNSYTGKDPRALSWRYWYGLEPASKHESWAVIPPAVVRFNTDRPDNFWTEQTLRQINR